MAPFGLGVSQCTRQGLQVCQGLVYEWARLSWWRGRWAWRWSFSIHGSFSVPTWTYAQDFWIMTKWMILWIPAEKIHFFCRLCWPQTSGRRGITTLSGWKEQVQAFGHLIRVLFGCLWMWMFSQHSWQLNGSTLAVRAIGQPILHTAYTVDIITFSALRGHPGEHFYLRTGPPYRALII